MDDFGLVQAACEGDKNAFAAIYDKYSEPIYSFLCVVMRNRDDAADVVQETFLTAGSRLHQLRDPRKLRPWLYAIARHTATRNMARNPRHDSIEALEFADSSVGPAEAASKEELGELISACAAGLNTRDRVVLDLHLNRGLEIEELAESIGVTVRHAHVMVTRLRDQVERSLGALLVARTGRRGCSRLSDVLSGWDGKFTATWRKRIARHVDECAVCGDLRRRVVSPASLLSAALLLKPPAKVRSQVLEEVQLTGCRTAPFRGGRDGFPPGMDHASSKRRVPFLGAAAVLVVLGISAGVDLRPPEAITPATAAHAGSVTQAAIPLPAEPAAGTGDPEASDTAVATPPPAPSQPESTLFEQGALPGSDNEALPGADPAAAEQRPAAKDEPGLLDRSPAHGQTVTGPPADNPDPSNPFLQPAPSGGGRQPPLEVIEAPPDNSDSVPQDQDGSSGNARNADPPPPPADDRGPSLGSLQVDPGQIWASGRCGTGRPQSARVSVLTSDTSGIEAVTLGLRGPRPGSVPLSGAGDGKYVASIGGFAEDLVAAGGTISIPLTVTSTDGAGNTSQIGGTLRLSCEPATTRTAEVPPPPPRR